ncbi:hypothetical protein NOF04DRAFT_6474 [Fusarium oxysporum II5]|nr:uncharacterized protein FOIG_09623 [Fusarium odoratissimum NRRL 54006]EXL98064.1 hypothetical protein FOIG_09623 [Fusarium odoratissimum NRRL 54006]KAK2124240.1 hypothetical protein NOF04DRAFT_6474 [Fusarium oxysporum II5]TXB95925.1 hypothetical protein FocTR4_00016708 [Fusarium oxysporum f. sp. cubense]
MMINCKSLLVVLAVASAVVASPCKPSTTTLALSTATTAIEETSSIETSTVSDATVIDTTATATATATTTEAGTTTTAAPTTVTTETEAGFTTTTVAETTSTAPSAAGPTACGIYGYFVDGNTLQYLNSPGTKDTAKDCLQACADYPDCEVVDFYNEATIGYEKGTCEFWEGTVKTNGAQSPYQWYQVGCLASM